MEKTLIFISDRSSYFFPYVHDENIRIENIWKEKYRNKNTFLMRVCRKLKIATGFFFGNWKKDIAQYGRIIIFDGCYDKLLTYYLNRCAPKSSKHIFCWNGRHRLGHVLGAEYPVYSYSPEDCKVLGVEYRSTIYSKDVPLQAAEEKYDVLFLGRAKKRMDKIEQIYQACRSLGLRTKFLVIGNDSSEVLDVQKETVTYQEYLNCLAQSKAILDICNDNQDGLSLRPMEALFFYKKLITDNIDIVNYDFYHPENIFVLKQGDMDGLKEFISGEKISVSDEVINRYEISNWIKSF